MEKTEETNQDSRIYEIGFHLAPTLAEDAISAEAEKIKDLIKKQGGEIISEGSPELKELEYDIEKHSKAYFGWVKFECSPEAVVSLKTEFDTIKTIIRYLITSTIKESTLFADKAESTKRQTSDEEIDKNIDELVIN